MTGPETRVAMSKQARLRHNADAARALPAPENRYRKSDLPEAAQTAFQAFVSDGIIEQVGTIQPGRGPHCGIYRTPPAVHNWIADHLAEAPTLPCGHSGFSNLRGGGYTCAEPSCRARHDRATVEAVYGGGSADAPSADIGRASDGAADAQASTSAGEEVA